MVAPLSGSAERFQFRLYELFILTAACAVFFALVRYQSALGLAIFCAVATVAVVLRRVPFRLNLAMVFGSAALALWGFIVCQFAGVLSSRAEWSAISDILFVLGSL